MTLQQTVTIPADRRLYLDLPRDIPAGKAEMKIVVTQDDWSQDAVQVVLTITSTVAKGSEDRPAPGCRLTPRQLAAIEECDGIAQGILSSDELLENRRKDKELEDAQLRRMLHLDEAID
jgi:hypothetical protein